MTAIYEQMESIQDFKEFSDAKHYIELPSDWSVIVAHVPDWAHAVESGRYRDINTIGAACITSVKNALKGIEFPYSFRGESATIVLPEMYRVQAVEALLALAHLVDKNFKLHLSIGSTQVVDLQRENTNVQVARYEIYAGMCIALFRGGGIALANEKIRNDLTTIQKDTPSSLKKIADLEGLSCRWNAIPSSHGCIMTILVCENPKVPSTGYDYVTTQIDSILGQGISKANPININKATYKGLRQLVREERRFHGSAWSVAFISRVVEIILCVLIFRLGLMKTMVIDSPSYAAKMGAHADYRKFDDILRMVVDCTQDQANAIEFMLQDLHQHGRNIFYGVFFAKHSLMACLVDDVADGKHVHFIDCDNGGYAMAAKALQQQIQQGFSESFALHQPIRKTLLDDDRSVEPRLPTFPSKVDAEVEFNLADETELFRFEENNDDSSAQWEKPLQSDEKLHNEHKTKKKKKHSSKKKKKKKKTDSKAKDEEEGLFT